MYLATDAEAVKAHAAQVGHCRRLLPAWVPAGACCHNSFAGRRTPLPKVAMFNATLICRPASQLTGWRRWLWCWTPRLPAELPIG